MPLAPGRERRTARRLFGPRATSVRASDLLGSMLTNISAIITRLTTNFLAFNHHVHYYDLTFFYRAMHHILHSTFDQSIDY